MCRTCTPPTLEHVLYDEVGLGDHHEQGHVRPGEQRELRMASSKIENETRSRKLQALNKLVVEMRGHSKLKKKMSSVRIARPSSVL